MKLLGKIIEAKGKKDISNKEDNSNNSSSNKINVTCKPITEEFKKCLRKYKHLPLKKI